ncbi:hypothetical protein NSA53_17345 [Cellulosimicrobium cellulans]|uniref:hypothetical protein n=1 Tax=Cellulosimicrobium cellulans TaxID=1710 RepID=UPI002149D441|nr:hypothetical protein [Cellulosimicrobium cellulans]
MRIPYEEWKPGADALATLRQADEICQEYRAQGFDLTLRQLYYQFVARGLIPNNQKSYKRLGDVVNRGRLAGFLDWSYIVDRTRNLRSLPHWSTPGGVIEAAASSYNRDKWAEGHTRVEVWVEKEALAGIVERAANGDDVAWFACRGYVSQSELWAAAQRHLGYIAAGQRVVVLHLGDHDPSGIDMTRDIEDRLTKFLDVDWMRRHLDEWAAQDEVTPGEIRAHMREHVGGDPLTVNRIALNIDQVQAYEPPPNPAKLTDSRSSGYVREFGYESWELDALDPTMLAELIGSTIAEHRDPSYRAIARDEAEERDGLRLAAARWHDVTAYLGGAR